MREPCNYFYFWKEFGLENAQLVQNWKFEHVLAFTHYLFSELKLSSIFIFALDGASKGFMKALKAIIKPFWGTTKKCENKNLT